MRMLRACTGVSSDARILSDLTRYYRTMSATPRAVYMMLDVLVRLDMALPYGDSIVASLVAHCALLSRRAAGALQSYVSLLIVQRFISCPSSSSSLPLHSRLLLARLALRPSLHHHPRPTAALKRHHLSQSAHSDHLTLQAAQPSPCPVFQGCLSVARPRLLCSSHIAGTCLTRGRMS